MFILHSFYGYKYSNLWCICSFNWLLIECFSSQWHTYNLSCSVIITGCGILCWSGRLKFHESIPTLMVFNPTDYSEKLHCLTLKNSAFYLSNRRNFNKNHTIDSNHFHCFSWLCAIAFLLRLLPEQFFWKPFC